MILWNKWRNPIAIFVMSAMLAVGVYASFAASADVNEAADAQLQLGAISKAASDIELAWFQIMGADSLATSGLAPAESQSAYDGAINLYNQSKAVLAAAGIEPIDQALAGSDQALAAMNTTFAGTLSLAASGDLVAAMDNHLDGTNVLYGNVEPAVKGLALVAAGADAELKARMDNGAADLRLLAWISAAFVALGAAFAGWSAYSIYRREEEGQATTVASEQPADFERAA